MPKKKKEKEKEKETDGKQGLVVGTTPGSFRLVDRRLMKPVCHQSYDGGVLQGSMLIDNHIRNYQYSP